MGKTTIGSPQIRDESIETADIKNGTIKKEDLNTTDCLATSTTPGLVTAVQHNKIEYADTVFADVKDPVGLLNGADLALSGIIGGTIPNLTLTGNSTTKAYLGNKVFPLSTNQSVNGSTDALTYFYINSSGVLTASSVAWDLSSVVPIAYEMFNDNCTPKLIGFDERHGISLSWAVHEYLHNTRGAISSSKFTLSHYTLKPASPVNSDNQIYIDTGYIYDEDIKHTLPALTTANYSVMYRNGLNGQWSWFAGQSLPFYAPTDYITYNSVSGSTWGTTALVSNRYMNMFVLATNALPRTDSYQFHFVCVMGQHSYEILEDALRESIADLDLTGFPLAEAVPLYQIIFWTDTTYTNTGKCRINSVTSLLNTTSIRNNNASSNIMVGATASTDGVSGYVPTPLAGDNVKVLFGDATYKFPKSFLDTGQRLSNIGVGSQAWHEFSKFIWPGSVSVGTPSQFQIVIYCATAAVGYLVQIVNLTDSTSFMGSSTITTSSIIGQNYASFAVFNTVPTTGLKLMSVQIRAVAGAKKNVQLTNSLLIIN